MNPLLTHASQVTAITLDPAQTSTHEVRATWHDEARTKIQCRYVDRRADDVGEGRVTWYYPSGAVRCDGFATEGKASGVWHHFDESGALTMVERIGDDGVFLVTQFSNGVRTREGKRRKDASGNLRDDGWWDVWNDAHHHQELYEHGAYIRARSAPAELRSYFARTQLTEGLATLANGNTEQLLNGVEGLLEEGEVMTLPNALTLVRLAWDHLLQKPLAWVVSFGRDAVPLLEAEARKVMADGYQDYSGIRRLAVLLWRCGGVIDEAFYPFFNKALQNAERASQNGETVDALLDALRSLPQEVREAMVLCDHSPDAWSHGTLLWTYAPTAPTHRVVTAALKAVGDMKKAEFKYNPVRLTQVQATFDAAALAFPLHLTGFLETVGKKAPQREVVVRALGRSGRAEVAATLMAFADDSLDEVVRAARDGLEALGDKAEPALEVGLKSKKARVKAMAEELLAARTRSGVEAPKPPSVVALEAARAALTDADRATFAGLDNTQTYHALNALSNVDLAPRVRALLSLEDDARACVQGTLGNFRLQEYLYQLKRSAPESPAACAELAGLLAVCAPKNAWNVSHLIETMLADAPDDLLDALGWHFEAKVPDIAAEVLKNLGEHAAPRATRAMVAAASDPRAGVRALAVKGLVKAGAAGAKAVLPLLARKDDGALSAAQVLALAPSSDAIAALEAALAGEKNKKRAAAFEEALEACRHTAGQAAATPDAPREASPMIDVAKMDADLAARAAKRKKKLPAVALPTLRWTTGEALSDGAARWLLGALVDAETAEPNTELKAVRAELRDDDCAELQRAIEASIPWGGEHRWKVYALPFLANDAQLRLMAQLLQSWASGGMHALAGHAIEALRRHGRGVAIEWVGHWADQGTGKLGRTARDALDALCSDRGLNRHALEDAETPRATSDAPSVMASIRKRLELAMLMGRSFDAAAIDGFLMGNPLVREAGRGALLRGADGVLALWEGEATLDVKGAAVTLARPVHLPHPCDIDDADLAAWKKSLAARGLSQPFVQLERAFSRDPDTDLKAFAGRRIGFRPMMKKLAAAGYHQSPPEDAGLVYSWARNLGSGWRLVASHDGYSAADGRGVNSSDTEVSVYADSRDETTAAGRPMKCEALADLKKIL